MKINISKHGGKLRGMRSISTSMSMNPLCAKRSAIKGSVCAECYARRFERFRGNLKRCLEENTRILRRRLSDHEIPRIDDRYFRIESFGDCASVTQASNYIRIAKANPETRFAVWTKNLAFYRAAFQKEGKPENLILVYSSPMIGVEGEIPDDMRGLVDHRFTVMAKGTDPSRINCGGRRCLGCLRCYRRNTAFDVYEIEK